MNRPSELFWFLVRTADVACLTVDGAKAAHYDIQPNAVGSSAYQVRVSMISICFHLLMAFIDAAAIFIVWQRRRFMSTALVLLFAGTLVLIFAATLGEDMFGIIRLLSYGIFIHGPIILGGSALVLWRAARKTALGCGILAASVAAVGVDAFFIEPHWLDMSHVEVRSSKLSRPLRIVVIADLQTDVVGPYEKRVFEQTLAEKPDLILLAGDYLQTSNREQADQLREKLNRLLIDIGFQAPLGVYAVGGNTDIPQWQGIFENTPATVISETRSIDLDRDDLRLTGLSLDESRDTQWSTTSSERFHICLGHCPDFALGDVAADLLVAGHTHGGQVQLPWIGPIITLSRVPRRWATGLTELESGGYLLVSRGIGMEREHAPRLRFLCRPELVVIDALPQ